MKANYICIVCMFVIIPLWLKNRTINYLSTKLKIILFTRKTQLKYAKTNFERFKLMTSIIFNNNNNNSRLTIIIFNLMQGL